MTLATTTVVAAPTVDPFAPRMLADGQLAQAAPTTPASGDSGKYRARMWTPRERTGAFDLHGGVFAPVHSNGMSPTIGARLGIHMGTPLLVGVMTDWTYQSRSLLQPSTSDLPGLEPKIVLAKAQASLIPVMLFMQVTLTQKFFLAPYLGIAGGYEWLMLKATDYRTAATASATYADLAWQSFGGVGLRLSTGVRLDSEVYYNGGVLGRDVTDTNGVTWRETVNANGAGARIGLHIVY
ncbi:MAG: hypothetical protein ACHQ52_06785 [Candidatus Eisenbacteria bacterium]